MIDICTREHTTGRKYSRTYTLIAEHKWTIYISKYTKKILPFQIVILYYVFEPTMSI